MIGYILIGIILLFGLYIWYTRRSQPKRDPIIKKLTKKAIDHTISANNSQDKLEAILHSVQATTYIDVLKSMFPRKKLLSEYPDFSTYEHEIYKTRDILIKSLSQPQQPEPQNSDL
jgi:hypothetical protein